MDTSTAIVLLLIAAAVGIVMFLIYNGLIPGLFD